MYALQHGVSGALARQLIDLTLIVVALSIVIHGISVTPLLRRYEKQHVVQRS
jgi:NhaP-type Na+/H+ or K+/H+ antiporter